MIVHWSVNTGGPTNFSVWPPEVVLVSNCHGPAPSNQTDPYAPGNISMGPGPICFEFGMGGTCTFTATQPSYEILLYNPWPNAPCPVNESVNFSVTYS